MAVKFYNYLTKKIEVFKPLKNKAASLYTCGPTVHNYTHIGNLRTFIFEDILRRILEYSGYKVTQVMNITNVEDKIIRDSKAAGKTIFEFVRPYEKAFFDDLKNLNIETAHKYPKATKHVSEMIKIIELLIKKKLAYEASDSIYFNISKFKKYGRLSGLKLRELKSGARTDADEYAKGNAENFVLWKAAKAGEPSWNADFSSAGPAFAKAMAGRPGWHIECSAMSMKYLGPTFDIHAGAVDLIFPHHENEIAQSEGATGKKFVNYFIEGEHLLVNSEKMSKSLGNVYTLRDIEKRNFDPLAFRYLTLTAHYRSKLNFTWKSLAAAQNALDNLREAVANLKIEIRKKTSEVKPCSEAKLLLLGEFEKHIYNDLGMPQALAVLWEVIKSEKLSADIKYSLITDFDKVLGLNLADVKTEKIPSQILKLAKDREKHRKEKNFKKADELRKKIESLGWLIEDTPQGPKLKKK